MHVGKRRVLGREPILSQQQSIVLPFADTRTRRYRRAQQDY